MYTQVKYLYSEADQFSKPLLSEAMSKDVFMAHIRKGVETLYIRTRTMLHNHRMYANKTLSKAEVKRIFRSEGFLVAAVIGIMIIISIFRPSTAPFIYGHGFGRYEETMYREEIYSLIPGMLEELNGIDAMRKGDKTTIDWNFLELQEGLYYMVLKNDGTYHLRDKDVEQSHKFTGVHTVFYTDGQVYSTTHYVNGNRLEDGYRSYYNNGNLRVEIDTNSADARFKKIIRYYYNNGTLWIEYKFYDEHRLYGKIYSKAGNLINDGENIFYAILVPGYLEDKDVLPTINPAIQKMMYQ